MEDDEISWEISSWEIKIIGIATQEVINSLKEKKGLREKDYCITVEIIERYNKVKGDKIPNKKTSISCQQINFRKNKEKIRLIVNEKDGHTEGQIAKINVEDSGNK